MVTRLADVVGAAARVELGDEVLLGVEAAQADAAGVEGGRQLKVMLAVHLQLEHRGQRLPAHDALHVGALEAVLLRMRVELLLILHRYLREDQTIEAALGD